MSDYLSNLVSKSLNQLETIQPRLPSLFEPMGVTSGLIGEDFWPEQPRDVVEAQFSELPKQENGEISVNYQPTPPQLPNFPQSLANFPQPTPAKQDLSPVTQPTFFDSPIIPQPTFTTHEQSPPSINQPPNLVIRENTPIIEPQHQNSPPVIIQQIVTENTVTERIVTPEPAAKKNTPRLEQTTVTPAFVEPPILEPITIHPTQVVISPQIAPVTPVIERQSSPTPTPQPTPTIQVTIGRIEVRATPTTTPQPNSPRPKPPVMSLETYLKQRGGK